MDKQRVAHGSSRGEALGFFLAIAGAILFSAKSILIKLAYGYSVTPVTLLALRMMFAMPVYVIIAVQAGRNKPPLSFRDVLLVMSCGLIGYYAASILDFAGLTYISAGLERLLLYTYPAMVLLLSGLAAGRPASRREILALGTTYFGVALVAANDAGQVGTASGWIKGVLFVLMSALAYALYLMGSQRIIMRLGALRYTALAMLAATAGTLLHFALSGSFAQLPRLPPAIYGYGLALGLFATVLPSFMVSAGIARIGAAKTAIIGAVGPATTMLLAWAVLDEAMTVVQIAGTAVIVYGVNLTSKIRS